MIGGWSGASVQVEREVASSSMTMSQLSRNASIVAASNKGICPIALFYHEKNERKKARIVDQ